MVSGVEANDPPPLPDHSASLAVPGRYHSTSPTPSPSASSAAGRYPDDTLSVPRLTPGGGRGTQAPRVAVRSHKPEVDAQVRPEPDWFERGRAFLPMVRVARMSI